MAGCPRLATLLVALWLPLAAGAAGASATLAPAPDAPPAPPLVLTDLTGQSHDLAAMRGQVVLVNFWATWCPPCRAEMPAIGRLRDALHERGFEVLAVDAGEDPDTVREFLGGFSPPLAFPVLLDLEGVAFAAWPVRGLPTTFVVGRGGRIRLIAEGARDFDAPAARVEIERLLGE